MGVSLFRSPLRIAYLLKKTFQAIEFVFNIQYFQQREMAECWTNILIISLAFLESI